MYNSWQIENSRNSPNTLNNNEEFNATGKKLVTLQDFIINTDRKRILKNSATVNSKHQLKVSIIESELIERKADILRRLLLVGPMQKINKMTILGDELGVHEAVDHRLGIQGRCGTTGRSALHEAAASGHTYLIRVLCREYNADTEKKTALGGCTALHLAVANGHRHACYLLIQQGAYINAKDNYGNCPIHNVISKSVLKLLLSKGASMLEKNTVGLKPLQMYLKSTELQYQDAKLISYMRECEEEERKSVFAGDVLAFRELLTVGRQITAESAKRLLADSDDVSLTSQDESRRERQDSASSHTSKQAVRKAIKADTVTSETCHILANPLSEERRLKSLTTNQKLIKG